MGEPHRDEAALGSKAVWLWALLGSLAIHFTLMTIAFSWKAPLPPQARKVVPVEAITLAKFRPGPTGGSGGLPAPATQTSPPAPELVAPAKPKPKANPKALVAKPVKNPESQEMPEIARTPPPAALAIPKPSPPPASPSRSLTTGNTTASVGRPGSSGSGQGGSGGGQGGGSGGGVGPGQGPGQGTGSLLQGYLREVRRLLERRKEYPSLAQRLNMQGVAVLQFTIAADGGIAGTRLARSSGHGVLDAAAQETVRRVGRFPPIPPGLGRERLTVEIPLVFQLRN